MNDQVKPSLGHHAEALLVRALLVLLRCFSLGRASGLGGHVARLMGPMIPVSNVARRNLVLAMPELTAAARREIIADTWENLGRTAAELARLGDFEETAQGPGFVVTGWDENVAPALAQGGPTIFFTGHFGNWEIIPRAAAARGIDVGFLYRAASNQLVDEIILGLREAALGRKLKMFPKGGPGARAAYAHLARGGTLAMLMDQKLDTGLAVPFFGREAMTGTAMASFALRFKCPVLPVHVVRTGPARLEMVCEPPMAIPNTGDKEADTKTMTEAMNRVLEGWIRAQPGGWLWLHKRWPKPLYKTRRDNE
ncbi:MAG: lauroyl acyltransferase [Acidocella sp.]|nr:lauroyl acyltransferase [Acidocella sp.]